MQDQRCFVQFMHPGGEHKPNAGNLRTWNDGPHKRKFLLCRGETESDRRERELMFWGEWEPPSEVVREFPLPLRDGPRYLYRPYWERRRSVRGLQNTDPFVFDGFFYSICKQLRGGRPTQLRHLLPGSVILFGSHLRGEFVLDTVFVVKRSVDHTDRTFRERLDGHVPRHYPDVALAPFYSTDSRDASGCAVGLDMRLYVGATVDDPVEGMFSYFPCADAPFERPRIELPGVVNPDSRQANRLNRGLATDQFCELWRQVREQVLEQGCDLGVRAEFPERR